MKNRIVGYYVGGHDKAYMTALDADLFGLPIHKPGLPASGIAVFDFPQEDIHLKEAVEEMLVRAGISVPAEGLNSLYKNLSQEDSTYVEGHTPLTKRMHSPDLNRRVHQEYFKLMRHLSDNLLKMNCYVQDKISVRVHQSVAVTPSVLDYYPYYHADFFLGHPPRNYNVYIPITDHSECESFAIAGIDESMRLYKKFGSAEALFEAVNGKSDKFEKAVEAILKPVRIRYGQFLVFDSRCVHSVLPMKNGKRTRLSIDARVISVMDHGANAAILNRPSKDRDFSVGAFFRKQESSH
jgi:hypothetical protein